MRYFLIFLFTIVSSFAENSATLAWDPNIESDLAGYKLYWGPSTGNYMHVFDVGNVTQYKLFGFTPEVVNFFAVTAYNADGLESDFSNEISVPFSAVHPIPSAPLNVTLTLTSHL